MLLAGCLAGWLALEELGRACFLTDLLASVHWESFGFVVAQVPEALRRVPV